MYYANISLLIVYLPWGRFVTDLIIDKNLAPEVICLLMNKNDRLRLFSPFRYIKNWDNLVIDHLNFGIRKYESSQKNLLKIFYINCSFSDVIYGSLILF